MITLILEKEKLQLQLFLLKNSGNHNSQVCQHSAGIGRGNKSRVAAQPGTFDALPGRFGGAKTLLHLFRSEMHIETTLDKVYVNHIAVYQCGDRAACCRLRGDVTDTGSASATGETTVGNQRDFFSQAHAHNVGGRSQHLLHPWPTTRPLVANDHDIALLYLPIQDTGAGLLLRIVDARGTTVPMHGGHYRANFDHRTIGGKVAKEDGKTAALAMRTINGENNLRILDLRTGNILAKGLERNGGTIQVEHPLFS